MITATATREKNTAYIWIWIIWSEGKQTKELISQEEIMQLLNKLYEQSTQGIAKVSPPIEELAADYLQKNSDVDAAAKQFVNYQI